jgi:hypothetical protein
VHAKHQAKYRKVKSRSRLGRFSSPLLSFSTDTAAARICGSSEC